MTEGDDWEVWLGEQFPGFLLPASMHKAVPPAVAARFLARLGRPDHLRVLQAAALFSPPADAEALRALVLELMPRLLDVLPSRTEVHTRRWEDGYQGRLDVRATLAERLAGSPSAFVTRTRRRSHDLPETVLLKQVLKRLSRELRRLRGAGLLSASWARPLEGLELRIGQLLEGTVLRYIEDRPAEPGDLTAARSAREAGFRAAADWHQRMRVAFDEPSAEATARVIARGALAPASEDVRFELAVLLRLLSALRGAVEEAEPGRWSLDLGLIRAGRADLATLRRDDGARIALHYNEALLPPGPRDREAAHYFGSAGRLRPDWTLEVSVTGSPPRYVVGEVKCSQNGAYLRSGFSEAVLYRFEYAESLWGELKSVLVVPGNVPGAARAGDATVAVGWAAWVPAVVLDGILEGVVERGRVGNAP